MSASDTCVACGMVLSIFHGAQHMAMELPHWMHMAHGLTEMTNNPAYKTIKPAPVKWSAEPSWHDPR